MTLSNRQIERYSRQIIVPGFGGAAQERLLASRLAIVGNSNDIEPALSYFAGAGVGYLTLVAGDGGADAEMRVARIRDLNPDVTLAHSASVPGDVDMLIAFVGDSESLSALETVAGRAHSSAIIAVRLDLPARIAVIPANAGCPRCVGTALLDPVQALAEYSEVVAMVAAVEALKLLAGVTDATAGALIEFDGPAASTRPLPADGVILETSACNCRHSAQEAAASR